MLPQRQHPVRNTVGQGFVEQRDGLVERRDCPGDRRMLRVHLTDKGRALMEQMLPDHFCRTTGLMANLTNSEKKTLIELLQKLQAGIPAMLEP